MTPVTRELYVVGNNWGNEADSIISRVIADGDPLVRAIRPAAEIFYVDYPTFENAAGRRESSYSVLVHPDFMGEDPAPNIARVGRIAQERGAIAVVFPVLDRYAPQGTQITASMHIAERVRRDLESPVTAELIPVGEKNYVGLFFKK